MNGFNENKVPSTHYPPISFLDETNPFPIQKEVEPMKLTIKTKNNTLEEYDIWFAGMNPNEMSSMALVKAQFDINRIKMVMSQTEVDYINAKYVDVYIDNYGWCSKIDGFEGEKKAHDNLLQFAESLGHVDDSYLDAICAIKEFNSQLEKSNLCSYAGEEYFSPSYVYSTRVMSQYSSKKGLFTTKNIRIDEMYVTQMTGEKFGSIIEFKSAMINDKGQHYRRTWPGVLFINKTDNGYRLMWRNNKTKTPIWGIGYNSMAMKKLVPLNISLQYAVSAYRDEMMNEEDILKITKYMPMLVGGADWEFSPHDEREELSCTLYPYGISQWDIYWIGAEVSTKKILNKAYKNPHGVTKKIFGDINNIKTFDDLRGAIFLLQIVRGFNPQILEQLNLNLVRRYTDYFARTDGAKKDRALSIELFHSFFRDFGFKDQYLTEMWSITNDHLGEPDASDWMIRQFHLTHSLIDTSIMFKAIKSRTLRTAIKQHVARSRMNIQEIHDFVNAEYDKIKTENKKFASNNNNSKLFKKFAEFDGKWIEKRIQIIVPKTTHELVEWGATQNNCIGSYAGRVYDGKTIVIGFKDVEGNWIGHADINNNMYINQLLGKHNQALSREDYLAITTFLKRKLKTTDLQTSMPMVEGYP